MNAMLTILGNDLRIFFVERGNLVGLVIMPLIFTLVLGFAFGDSDGGPTRLRVDVLDRDKTPESADLLAQIHAANSSLVFCAVEPPDKLQSPSSEQMGIKQDIADFCGLEDEPLTQEMALERARSEYTQALIVIPTGYAEALLDGGRAQIDLYAAGNTSLPNGVEQTVSAVLQRVNSASIAAAVSGALLDNLGAQIGLTAQISPAREPFVRKVYADAQRRTQARTELVDYRLTRGEADTAGTGGDGFAQSVPGMASMFVMFTVLRGMIVLLRERRQWTLQRLVALPLARTQILGGKVLTYFSLGMIQFLLVFGVGLAVGLDFGDRPLALLPIMVAFALCCTGLAFAIAPFITSEGQANGISNLLALSLAPLGGAWWPLEIVPDFMRTLGHISPVAWAMDAFQAILWYNGGLRDVLPEIGVLLAASAFLFAIGVRRFRYL